MNAPKHVIRLASILALLSAAPAVGRAAELSLVSRNAAGIPGAGDSEKPVISGDGRFAAFESSAEDLVPGTFAGQDVYVVDLATGAVEVISRAANGGAANGVSQDAVISKDGRFVAFRSRATNLTAPAVQSSVSQIYRHDRETGVTTLVSKTTNGTPANATCSSPAISGDGQVVAFTTTAANLAAADDNGVSDVYCFDVAANRVRLESVTFGGESANGASQDPSLDFDGDRMAFATDATNLAQDDTNGVTDVIVRLRSFGSHGSNRRPTDIEDAAQPNGRTFRPAISADGRAVAFASDATNLVAGDTNGVRDVFVHDQAIGIQRVSVTKTGTQGSRDSDVPAISGSGRFAAFVSASPEFAIGIGSAQGAFVFDAATSELRLVSIRTDGTPQQSPAFFPSLDLGGTCVMFHSADTGLVTDDANGAADVFVERAPFFNAGDVLLGNTRDLDVVREVAFDGVKGMKLTLVMEQAPAGTEIEVRLVLPSGKPSKKVNLETDDDDTLKISKNGLHRLRFLRKDGADGAFRIATAIDLPKSGEAFADDDVDLEAGDDFERKLLALPGSRLKFAGRITGKEFGAWNGAYSIATSDRTFTFENEIDTEFTADRPATSFSTEIPVRRLGKFEVTLETLTGVDVESEVTVTFTLPEGGALIALP